MKYHLRIFWLIITTSILILGFQNCGSSSFSTDDFVKNEPLNSINTGDTQYKGGQSFDLIATSIDSSSSQLKVSRTTDGKYRITDDLGQAFKCALENSANPAEELLQLSDSITVSHPALVSDLPEVCDTDTLKHVKVGDTSALHLIPKDQDTGCLLDDPERLLNEGKRVFIIDNLSYDEIELLVNASKEISKDSSCQSLNIDLLVTD